MKLLLLCIIPFLTKKHRKKKQEFYNLYAQGMVELEENQADCDKLEEKKACLSNVGCGWCTQKNKYV